MSKSPQQSEPTKSSKPQKTKTSQVESEPALETADQELAQLARIGAGSAGGEGDEDPASRAHRIQHKQAEALSRLQKGQRSRHFSRIQRVWGNTHAVGVMRLVQESEARTKPAAVQKQDENGEEESPPKPWTPPFKLPVATTRDEAAQRLGMMRLRLLQLKGALENGDVVTGHIKNCEKLETKHLGNADNLTAADTGELEFAAALAKATYESEVKAMKRKVVSELDKAASAPAPNTSVVERQVAIALHSGFMEGGDEEIIADLKKVLTTVNDYKDKVDKAAGVVKAIAKKVKATKILDYVEKYSNASEVIGKISDAATQALDAAKALHGMMSEKGYSSSMNALNQFDSAIKAIGVGASLVKAAPLVGTLWSDYYQPLTEACIKYAKIIVRAEHKRIVELILFETNDRTAAGAPRLPNNPLVMQHFPGGQAILDYMYQLMMGGAPGMSSYVEQFFIERKDFFNIGLEEREQLETESTFDIWSPSTWFNSEEHAPGLGSWLMANKDVVWASLYGGYGDYILGK